VRFPIIALLVVAACAQPEDVPEPPPELTPIEHLLEVSLDARRAYFDHLLKVEATELKRIVSARERLGSEAREDLARRGDVGVAAARAVIEQYPDRVEGHLYLAANLGVTAAGKGNAAALFGGIPGKMRTAYERALEIDPKFDSAGPLRIKGSFLGEAPWPVGDSEEALKALKEAVRIAPVAENYLMLGDLHYRQGRIDEAVQCWHAAVDTREKAGSWQVDGRVRDLARKRLAVSSSRFPGDQPTSIEPE
jgi:tetratricopeptide (TPR) repeat protein